MGELQSLTHICSFFALTFGQNATSTKVKICKRTFLLHKFMKHQWAAAIHFGRNQRQAIRVSSIRASVILLAAFNAIWALMRVWRWHLHKLFANICGRLKKKSRVSLHAAVLCVTKQCNADARWREVIGKDCFYSQQQAVTHKRCFAVGYPTGHQRSQNWFPDRAHENSFEFDRAR